MTNRSRWLMLAGRWGGARVGIHWLFLLMLGVVSVLGYGLQAVIMVASLIAHELAHLAAAWAVGVEVQEVYLTPLGGVARLAGQLEAEPQNELTIALAGPFQSFLLAGLAQLVGRGDFWRPELVEFCFEVNVSLALFNLLPALPLDGGRAVRGILAQRLGHGRVTGWMVLAGRLTGLVLTAAGGLALAAGQPYLTAIVGGPYLIWLAGQEEEQMLLRSFRQLLRKRSDICERRIVPARNLVALADVRLAEILPHLAARRYHTVQVVDDACHQLGLISEAQILTAFQAQGPQVRLGDLIG